MFDSVQKELNELVSIVHQTALVNAGLVLDPGAKRSEATMLEHACNEQRKVFLMEKYNLTAIPVYDQRQVASRD
jgi:hypothetical protein